MKGLKFLTLGLGILSTISTTQAFASHHWDLGNKYYIKTFPSGVFSIVTIYEDPHSLGDHPHMFVRTYKDVKSSDVLEVEIPKEVLAQQERLIKEIENITKLVEIHN